MATTTDRLTIPPASAPGSAYCCRGVIGGEKDLLRAVHRARFEGYARLSRFWSRLSGYSEPARWEFSRDSYGRSVTEVIWFVCAAIVGTLLLAIGLGSLLRLY